MRLLLTLFALVSLATLVPGATADPLVGFCEEVNAPFEVSCTYETSYPCSRPLHNFPDHECFCPLPASIPLVCDII